ncbi:glycosyltransferase [Neobacillus niacini]|uniref:glycosyltransferase n=1 Tax=Neobacillus niacini TaxID=86668 RepID=UPI002FFFEAA0
MKVLQINSVCGIGSTGRIATDMDKLLKENGYESYIAYGRGEAMNCDTSIRIGKNIDNYLHVAKTRIFDQHGFGSIKSTKEFIKNIEALNFDVIHLHNIHGYYVNIEILFDYLKSVNKPIIWTLHDCWAFTGHCSYFDYAKCDKWITGCHTCPQKSYYPTSLWVDNSSKNYHKKRELFTGVNNLTIVTPSKWLANIVQQSFLGEYPVKVINNGINVEMFMPRKNDFREKYNLNNKYIILGVASYWNRRKGFEYFIELSSMIRSDEIIVLIGLTDKQKINLPNNILGISKTNSVEKLAEIYSSADVFINPTLEDNFPTTNLEALACGTPVITFQTGGSVESVDNSCGKVVEQGNITALIAAINEIRETNNYRHNCVIKGKSYDKSQRFHEYIELYESLI